MATGAVEARGSGVAAAGQVQGRQVEDQTQQVIAQGFGGEFIDFIAHLLRHAGNDGAHGPFVVSATLRKCWRAEESINQAQRRGGA